MKINKLGLVKYLIILALALWSLPTYADETSVDISTSTPETETASSTPDTDTASSTPETPEESIPSSTLIIRYQDQIVWSGNISLTEAIYHDTINNTDYTLTTPTVFSALALADQQSEAFSISDAQYNAGFGSFYLACLDIITSTTPAHACFDWNYVVNNTYPNSGMDHFDLHGGETIYIYFSSPWRITATNSSITAGTPITLQTWRYQYDNLVDPWIFDAHNVLDISVPNPTPIDWWDTLTFVTSTETNASGTVDYVFTNPGSYSVNFHDFTKWSPITISVTEPTTTPQQPPTGGGGGSNGPVNQFVSQEKINETIEKLLSFIKSKQESDGRIVDGGISDWLAMNFGAKNIYTQDVKNSNASLFSYIYNYSITELDNELNACAAYPRHILALLASGVGNTDTTVAALKNKLDTCVTNNTFGANGINDDIFGLFAAVALQENNNSPVVQTTIAAIIANQQPSGAFAYPGPFESPDLTGAAINALKYAQSNGATVNTEVFTKARLYLKAQQLADGGWGFGTSDPLTTGWAMMGINALGEGQNDWFNTVGKNPWHILTTLDNDHFTQSWDGNIDWFGTKHAIPALLGKSWPIILTPTNNTQNQANSGSVGGSNPTTSTPTENTSIIAPTSTPTTTAIALVPETPAEPENTILVGEILGEKIVNESTKPAVIKKRTVAAQNTTAPVTQTAVSGTEAQPTSMPTESATPDNITIFENSNNHLLVKIILLASSCTAVLIGLYLGIKNLKKK